MAVKQKSQQQKAPPEQRLLWSATEVGFVIGLSRSKVFELVTEGALPESIKIGHSRKWHGSDILKWIELGCPCLEKFNQLHYCPVIS